MSVPAYTPLSLSIAKQLTGIFGRFADMFVQVSPVFVDVTTLYPASKPPKQAHTVEELVGRTVTSVILIQFDEEGNPVLPDLIFQLSPVLPEKYNATEQFP